MLKLLYRMDCKSNFEYPILSPIVTTNTVEHSVKIFYFTMTVQSSINDKMLVNMSIEQSSKSEFCN